MEGTTKHNAKTIEEDAETSKWQKATEEVFENLRRKKKKGKIFLNRGKILKKVYATLQQEDKCSDHS